MIARIAVIAIVAIAATAHASTVMELSPDALAAGADRIVDATVLTKSMTWNATHDGVETHATLAIERAHKGAGTSAIEIVVPGGTVGTTRQIVFGTPAVVIGERARWFLRDRGDGTFRVYGWAQGKWPQRFGIGDFAPSPVEAEHDPSVIAFATNGMIWPAAKQPVQYLVQNAGSADVSLPDEIAAIDAAFATWQAVPTASLTFVNAGMTDLGMAVDGTNVILFIESGWIYGTEAAAATSLFIIDGQQTADIAVNGENFTWAIGPPGSGISSDLLDLQAVLTHEIGHFSGLDHTLRAYDTMYYSWKPWPGQRTISIDDKRGLSAVYPMVGNECTTAATTCPADETCKEQLLGWLCEGAPDPIGSPCNYDRVECDSFCLFTVGDLSNGYCSKFCETDADCPLTHHCDAASAGTMPVRVCFAGAQPKPPPQCIVDVDCPTMQHCASGACTFECRESADCDGGGSCDDHGYCVAAPPDDNGGCQSGGGGEPVLMLGALWLLTRRRATITSSRTARSRA